jgi:hypothetical protein
MVKELHQAFAALDNIGTEGYISGREIMLEQREGSVKRQ